MFNYKQIIWLNPTTCVEQMCDDSCKHGLWMKGKKNDFIFQLIVYVLLFANTIQLVWWLGYIYKIYPIFLILPFNVVNIVKKNTMWNEPLKNS
jgi:hypothetical protein